MVQLSACSTPKASAGHEEARTHSPKAPSTCTQAPAARAGYQFGEAVELAGVHFTCLEDEQGTPVQLRQAPGVDTAVGIHWRVVQSAHAESEDAQSLLHGDVSRLRQHHANFRGAHQTVLVEVPAEAGEQLATRCAQAGQGAGGGAGAKANGTLRRQAEGLADPARGDLLQLVGSRRIVERGGALIPGQHQAFGGRGSRKGSAYDEAEVARSVGGYRGWRAQCIELVQHFAGQQAGDGERLVEAAQGFECSLRRENPARGVVIQISQRAAICLGQ